MGQIVSGAAKPKRCNLNKLSQLSTPAAGEYILVSSDNSMNEAGQGNFDCYIEGNGTTAASALELQQIDDVKKVSTNEADLDISDEEGNVLVRFADGEFKVKNFDTGKVPNVDDDDTADLNISDEEGNVLVSFFRGHIRTKHFNSSQINNETLPEYWLSYLTEKIQSINTQNISVGRNGVVFTFITDTHWANNAKKSPAIIEYIKRHTDISNCICGGDIIVGHGGRADKLAEMRDFMYAFREVNPTVLIGNHDYNTSDQPSGSWDAERITPEEHYRICNAPKENIIHYTGNPVEDKYDEYYGYNDNISQKVRFIYLDSGAVHRPSWADTNLRMSQTQIDWMTSKITELENGWSVIVFVHIFYQNSSGDVHGIGNQIEAALDAIYDTSNADIIGVICGHVHGTVSHTSVKGYPIIATANDAYLEVNNDEVTREAGTISEQSFDIYFINTSSRTINVMRIGAGDTEKDRVFNY